MNDQQTPSANNKPVYPANFLMDLAEGLENAVHNVLETYQVPEDVRHAVNSLVYLNILITQSDHPEEFGAAGAKGYDPIEGYRHEVRAMVEQVALAIFDLETQAKSRSNHTAIHPLDVISDIGRGLYAAGDKITASDGTKFEVLESDRVSVVFPWGETKVYRKAGMTL